MTTGHSIAGLEPDGLLGCGMLAAPELASIVLWFPLILEGTDCP